MHDEPTIPSDTRTSRTPWVVLGLLTYEPMSGYDLRATIGRTVGHFWNESFGQLYPMLRELHYRGWVTLDEQAHGGRTRKVYSITDAGSAAFASWLEAPWQPSKIRSEMLLKVFFASQAQPSVVRSHLEQARGQAERQRNVLEDIRGAIEKEQATAHQRRYWLLTIDLGLRSAQATEDWARAALAELAHDHPSPGPRR